MRNDLTAYVRVNDARIALTSILSLTLEKEVIKKLKDDELNSLIAHLQEVLRIYDEYKNNNEPDKALVYLLSLYMGRIAEDYLINQGRL